MLFVLTDAMMWEEAFPLTLAFWLETLILNILGQHEILDVKAFLKQWGSTFALVSNGVQGEPQYEVPGNKRNQN